MAKRHLDEVGNYDYLASNSNLPEVVVTAKAPEGFARYAPYGYEGNSGTISQDNRSWQRRLTDNIVGFVKNNKTHPAVIYPLAAATAASFLNPLSTLRAIGLGSVGKQVVDSLSKNLTGKSFAENASNVLDINPEVAELLNPGYLASGISLKGYNGNYLFNNIGQRANNTKLLNGVTQRLNLPFVKPINQIEGNTINTLALPTSKDVLRNQLKRVNAWGKRFGYEPIDLKLSEDPLMARAKVVEMMNRHNTFIRGAGVDKRNVKSLKDEIKETHNPQLAQYYFNLERDLNTPGDTKLKRELRDKYLTTYADRNTKGGRANVPDNVPGTIYTSNMFSVGAHYARTSYMPDTKWLGLVRRKDLNYSSSDLTDLIIDNDFNFNDEASYYRRLLLDNEVAKTGKLPKWYSEAVLPEDKRKDIYDKHYVPLKDNDRNTLLSARKRDYELIKRAYDDAVNIYKMFIDPNYVKPGEATFDSFDSHFNRLAYQHRMKEILMDLNSRIGSKYHRYNKKLHYNVPLSEYVNEYKKVVAKKMARDIGKATQQYKNKLLIEKGRELAEKGVIPKFNPTNTSQPFFEDRHGLRSSTKNTGDARQHFVFIGNPGEQGLDLIQDITTEIKRKYSDSSHFPHGSVVDPRTSRRSRKFGGYELIGRRSLKSGGTIYIKPENRGKFNATKERTGKTTEELTHSKNPLTRKRAIFAQNAAKWKK